MRRLDGKPRIMPSGEDRAKEPEGKNDFRRRAPDGRFYPKNTMEAREAPTHSQQLARALKHYVKWRVLPFGEQFPLNRKDFGNLYGVSEATLQKWENKLAKEQEVVLGEDGEVLDYDVKRFFDGAENKMKWLKGVLASAEKGNAQSQLLIAKILGAVVDKPLEVKLDLSAEEYFRIWREARRKAEATQRDSQSDRGLLPESSLLPEELRTD